MTYKIGGFEFFHLNVYQNYTYFNLYNEQTLRAMALVNKIQRR